MGATPMQMNVQENATPTVQYAFFYNIKLVKRNNKFIIAGSVNFNGMFTVFNFSMGGQLIKHGMFLGCFDANGQFLWKKEGSVTGGGFTFRPVIDKQKNFILSTNSGTNKDTLNGTPLINPLGPHSFPLAVKLDSMGNTIWIKSSATNSATLSSAIALNESTNKVYVYGNYPGTLIWDSLQFKNLPNQGYDPFLVTLNAQTGAVLQLDSLESDFGNDEYCGPMVSDKKGNLYMGGTFSGNLYVNGTTLTNSGGRNDFFIAKYGAANCNTAFPVKLLSFTGKQKDNTIQLY